MPAWALWPWNHISTSHPHGKQKSKYNPKLKRGAWRVEGARALPWKIKSQSHEWTDAEGGHRSVCTPWRRSSAISQQRGRAKEGEKFLKHFTGAPTDYVNILNPRWRWLVVLNLALNWKGCQKKQKLAGEFKPVSVVVYTLLLCSAVPVARAVGYSVWIQIVRYLPANFLLLSQEKKKKKKVGMRKYFKTLSFQI